MIKPAILIVGHARRDREGPQEFQQLVDLFGAQDPGRIVECGFLEFAEPVIQAGVDRCVARGATVVTVLPGMLMAAGHAKNDIPSEIQEARLRYPHVAFHYGRHLHLHANIIELCRLKIEETERTAAEAAAEPGAPPHRRAPPRLVARPRRSRTHAKAEWPR